MANRSHSCALQLDISVCDTLHTPRVTCGVGKLLQAAATDSSLGTRTEKTATGPGIQRGSSMVQGIRYSASRTFLRGGSDAFSSWIIPPVMRAGFGNIFISLGESPSERPANVRFALGCGAIGAGEGVFLKTSGGTSGLLDPDSWIGRGARWEGGCS